jgi:PKD repeat protein
MRKNPLLALIIVSMVSFASVSVTYFPSCGTFSGKNESGSSIGTQLADKDNPTYKNDKVKVYCDFPFPEALGLPPNSTIMDFGGPRMGDEVVERLRQAAEHGVRIHYGIGWWGEPGMEYHNALDIFYNESFRNQVYEVIDYNFHGVPPDFYHGAHEWSGLDPELIEKILSAGLSGEEPLTSYCWSDLYGPSDDLAKYSDIYYEETGYQLKGFNDMLEAEQVVFSEWMNEKNVWVFNHLYDYVKSKWPHLQVFQNMFLDTGPMKCAVYELKAEGFMIDIYLAGFFVQEDGQWRLVEPWRDNPWFLYEVIRRYKTMLPDKEFHAVLWGSYTWPWEGEFGGFEHIRRNAWVAYLAGADAVAWFTWDPEGEEIGNRLLMYTTRLNRELVKLPVVKPEPQVLAIYGDYIPDPELGLFSDLGLFSEYDIVDQRFFAKADMDLSKYKLIVVAQWKYYDETVHKLNDYVANGGNVIFLFGTGYSPYNIYGNETRKTRFSIEEDAVQYGIGGHVMINISRPNMLDLELNYDAGDFGSLMLRPRKNENYHPIGDFWMVKADGTTRKIDGHPLVLFHDASNPDSGWVLYWGLRTASRSPSFSWANREDVEDVNFLYREFCRAFALNFLNMNSSISSKDTENILITQSKLDDETVLAGLSNFNFENRSITYSLDLDHFRLPYGEYWVHSLDENATIGLFESNASMLKVPVDLPGNNATKLLLISQEKPEPTYSIEIYPKRPSADDIPTASFTYSPINPSHEDTVDFIDTSTDMDGTIVFWSWNFGDGTRSQEQNPSHQYAWKGEYPVELIVTDNDGGINAVKQMITVQGLHPNVEFSYYPSDITSGQEVYFTDISIDPDGSIASWLWDFGDGSTSTEPNPAHFFIYPGSYTVTLSVEDDEGLESSYSTTIVVEAILMQVAAQLSSETITKGDPVTISVEVKDDVYTPIEGAMVLVTYGEETLTLSDQGNGNYEGTINTSIFKKGTYEIVVTAEKEQYKLAQTSLTLNVEVETPWILIGGIAAVVIIIVSAALYLVKRRF